VLPLAVFGTGYLEIPVLAAANAYGVCDLTGKLARIDLHLHEAPEFYSTVALFFC